MINLGLLLTNHYRLLSVAAILDVFETVNGIYFDEGQDAPFDIHLFYDDEAKESSLTAFFPGYHPIRLCEASKQDLILIPSFVNENVSDAIQDNHRAILWLRQQYQMGAGLASFCTGAFLLGATGLLNGKIATTHVDACKAFTQAFPEIKLEAEKTVTQDGRLYTSGGATSSFHLMLHLIQLHCGKEVAVRIAKLFAIDMDRQRQSYFSTFHISRNHSDDLVAMAQQKIETAYHNTGTIEEMIKDIPASRRNIVRRFKQVTGITPIEYLQQTRIEAAKKLLEQTVEQMTEVIYKSGYNDPKAFRKVFRKTVGMTPSEYREKFYVG
ncbi:GlxA family transcriptional regulator [Pedobacter hartonius]|uniref:Transcriptional regulator GlxA family, contains an amidase domain and an AraC-type DNA-binding HTH domain n=1 Tax=Pedobacter hartonius TaxID=425514 RepID=A0A1H4GIU0_9SPHI|nr:helix-turn-helix domain-containing protein [Pedobacter hartonius]SEB09539.1 Transcriptional regulator GlxA family, contains an amidase domain and an AraC-type DNA-binding HTH domain [Pedobacter hartonius]